MQNHIKDDDLTYALDSSGRMVYIDSIPPEKRGLACDCVCPKCKMPMIAKLGHDVPHRKKPHFAHSADSNCQGYCMTALHLLAEQIIEDKKAVMAPAYKSIPSRSIKFTKVIVENRVERKDLQPDVAGYTEEGYCINIEIRNTSEVKEKKKIKIKESNITCLEIDVRDQKLDELELEKFLLFSTDKREWINNPIYDKIHKDTKKQITNTYTEALPYEEEIKYLEFDVGNQSISTIYDKLNEIGVVDLGDDLVGSIEYISNENKFNGIVILCKCNDRVSPYYVLSIWKEDNKLRYEIINRSREVDKRLAEKYYYKTVRRFVNPNNCREQEENGKTIKEINNCPF